MVIYPALYFSIDYYLAQYRNVIPYQILLPAIHFSKALHSPMIDILVIPHQNS